MSDFYKFRDLVTAQTNVLTKNERLFVVGVSKDQLWEAYLSAFPEGTNPIYRERSDHECNNCKNFIRNMGDVVSIKDGQLASVWDVQGAEFPYNIVAEKLSAYVKSFPVVDEFKHFEAKVGKESTKDLHTPDKTWNHFHCVLPKNHVMDKDGIASYLSNTRTRKEVFKRALSEISIGATEMTLEFIDEGLNRGPEYREAVVSLLAHQKQYADVPNQLKDNWAWEKSNTPHAKVKTLAIGTLLEDLTEGKYDVEVCISKFEDKVHGSKFMRSKPLFSPKQREAAKQKIIDLGYGESLQRRHAQAQDISIENVLFANRDIRPLMRDEDIFDTLPTASTIAKSKKPQRTITIEDFIRDVVPKVSNIEVFLENQHKNNMVSLIAPVNKEAPSMFRWKNGFSWAYPGDVADAIKQNVKQAGGNVEGVLRFSIQWNDGVRNLNDLDAHCFEPNGNHIWFHNKSRKQTSSGMLDVDIMNPQDKVAVENIFYSDLSQMPEGIYDFKVHCYNHRGGTGFKAQIEFDGQIFNYQYEHNIRDYEYVDVASVSYSKKDGFKIIKSLDSTQSAKEMWGVRSHTPIPVEMMMYSPNFWEGEEGKGLQHVFFCLKGCKADAPPRGFFSEFLNPQLRDVQSVMESLGSVLRAPASDNQLSGVGFSLTQENSLVVKVEGEENGMFEIKFNNAATQRKAKTTAAKKQPVAT